MFHFPHRIRFVRAAALLVALAAALAPAAQAADKSDAVDRALRNNAAPLDVRSPDRKSPDYAKADPGNGTKQYGIPRAMPSHYAEVATLGQQVGLPRATPADYAAAGIDGNSSGTQVDFRSADTRDAAIGRYPDSGPVLVSVPRGFDWGDATFGAGAAALVLLLAGGIAIAVRQRKRVVLS